MMWINGCSIAQRLLLFVAFVEFTDHPSASGQSRVRPEFVNTPGECYACVALEGISNPQCEFPVARKALTTPCQSQPKDKVRSKCAKIVLYAKAYKKGQTLKSWLMKRECLTPMSIKERYDNLDLECDTCGRVKDSVRIFQRLYPKTQGWHQRLILPDEQEQVVILMCVCCKALCNAEEGFNLSQYQLAKRSDSSTPQARKLSLILLFSLQFTVNALLR